MQIAALVNVLDDPHLAAEALLGWRVKDVEQARKALLDLTDAGLSLDLMASICKQLAQNLPKSFDPDQALVTFCQYVSAVRSPLAFAALLERDASAMPMLLAALSLGPGWAGLLIADPDAFDLLRETEGKPLDRATLVGNVVAEVAAFSDERSVVAVLARARNRHSLKIAYGEIAGAAPLPSTMEQLSWLNEALIEAAFRAARQRDLAARSLPPRTRPADISAVVLAVGRLGSGEMDYAAPLELLVAYDFVAEDATTVRAVHEHFERTARLLARLLAELNGPPSACSVQLLPLPDSSISAAAHSAEDVAVGFETFGRTWHRQAMLRARPVAGDRELGAAIVARLEAWLFRRYLSRADETGIKALKRRIVMQATLHQDDWRDPELARGGLRNLESVIEFLQLLVGGDQVAARSRSTLGALPGLELAGAITPQERALLEECYVFLRRLQHRLQIMVEPPAAELPADDTGVERIAAALGVQLSANEFAADIRTRLARLWQTMRKLLDSAFPDEPNPPREVELLLDPDPPQDEVRAALAPFGFSQPQVALAALNDLAAEQVPFLSTRRCRDLLATILPQLLCAIAATPNPDRTLGSLTGVSTSLGGKGVLWSLFRFHPPLLQLYVRLCAASPYLSDILTTNPGMIDELLDSLQLDRLPERKELDETLTELCRGASDTVPILHDFKSAQHLRIGVRDILGKEDVDRTHQALADVAEVCLNHVAQLECAKLIEKYGTPTVGSRAKERQPCPYVIVGLGKLGGREPNYHSDLDLLFLYEAEGTTRPTSRSRSIKETANNHFFTQLAQRITKQLASLTAKGRLYTVQTSLRPIGLGGALALSFADFAQHFAGGAAPLWQWQALCQARAVVGDASDRQPTDALIRKLLTQRPSAVLEPQELRRSRLQFEKGASSHNLKRGPGGTLDIEFLVQFLQLDSASADGRVLTTSTQDALSALWAAGVLPSGPGQTLGDSYRFLRRVESALRLLNTSARHDLPADAEQLGQLALLLGHSNPNRLREECLARMAENRAVFDTLFPP